LAGDERVTVHGPGYDDDSHHGCLPTLSITIEGITPLEASLVLDQSFNVAVRAELQCAPRAHEMMGTAPHGTIRLSAGVTTTADEIERATAAFDELLAGVATT
jgi:selenocysteine lyase/cysteine desulfurase